MDKKQKKLVELFFFSPSHFLTWSITRVPDAFLPKVMAAKRSKRARVQTPEACERNRTAEAAEKGRNWERFGS
jgi:hypothetical protein